MIINATWDLSSEPSGWIRKKIALPVLQDGEAYSAYYVQYVAFPLDIFGSSFEQTVKMQNQTLWIGEVAVPPNGGTSPSDNLVVVIKAGDTWSSYTTSLSCVSQEVVRETPFRKQSLTWMGKKSGASQRWTLMLRIHLDVVHVSASQQLLLDTTGVWVG